MYTNTSKFRLRGKYGLFTIPKGILNDLSWGPGDLLDFWETNGNVINIRRVCTSENLEKFKKEGGKYNTKIYKRIVKFGGKTGTYGVKSLPEFLIKEFKLKDNKTIYFIPAKYTWFGNHYSQNELNNIIFVAFDPKHLKRYDKPPKEERKKQEKEYKQWLIKEYELPFFNKKLELAEKNSKRAKNKVKTINLTINKDRILGLGKLIERLEKGLKKVESSMHPKKREIIKDVKKNIRELKSKVKELGKNPIKMFKEWQE